MMEQTPIVQRERVRRRHMRIRDKGNGPAGEGFDARNPLDFKIAAMDVQIAPILTFAEVVLLAELDD